jgi:SAM-dependent methyltransferase
MLPRTLEPEVMDTRADAVDYDSMDHSEVNRIFAEEFFEAAGRLIGFNPAQAAERPGPLLVLDVGTGTARIPIDICRRTQNVRITAIDLGAHMLQLGQRNVIEAGLDRQIILEQVDAKSLPYPENTFDAVISNSIVHHIPQPSRVVGEMLRVARPGGLLFVRDLLRPEDAATIAAILARHAGGTNDHQRQLFEASLHASLTLDEVGDLLQSLGLPPTAVTRSSDRHWTIAARKEATPGESAA